MPIDRIAMLLCFCGDFFWGHQASVSSPRRNMSPLSRRWTNAQDRWLIRYRCCMIAGARPVLHKPLEDQPSSIGASNLFRPYLGSNKTLVEMVRLFRYQIPLAMPLLSSNHKPPRWKLKLSVTRAAIAGCSSQPPPANQRPGWQ